MPTYDYRCPRCGARHTLHTSYAEADRQRYCGTVAPRDSNYWGLCRGELERQPSAPAFVVKGFNAKNGYSDAD